MAVYSKAKKDSIEKDLCFVCGQSMLPGEACWWAGFGVRIHATDKPPIYGTPRERSGYTCDQRFTALLRDYAHSTRGRWRPKTDVLRDAYAARCAIEKEAR